MKSSMSRFSPWSSCAGGWTLGLPVVWGSPGGERVSSQMHSSGQKMHLHHKVLGVRGLADLSGLSWAPRQSGGTPGPAPEMQSETMMATSKAQHLFATGDSGRQPGYTGDLSLTTSAHTFTTQHLATSITLQPERTPTLGLHASQTHSPPFPVTTTNPLPTAVPGLTLWGRMGGKPSSDVPSNSHSSRGPCWKVVSAPSAQWRDLPGAPKEKLVSLMVTPGLKI